jgi:hypothetical protein
VYAPRICLASFEVLPNEEKKLVLDKLLEALTLANVFFLARYPHTPNLYESGVRYEQEPDGRDDWQDIPDTLQRRNGDCEDLASWRMAELRARWRDRGSRFHITVEDIPNRAGQLVTTYHIAIRLPDGRIEDPSRILGMR